jgi:hypothetical protein
MTSSDDGEETCFEAAYPREERADRNVNESPSSLLLQNKALMVGDLPAAIRFLADGLEDRAQIRKNMMEDDYGERNQEYLKGSVDGFAQAAGLARMVDMHVQNEEVMQSYRNVEVNYDRFKKRVRLITRGLVGVPVRTAAHAHRSISVPSTLNVSNVP